MIDNLEQLENNLKNAGWILPIDYLRLLSENDINFITNELTGDNSLNYYIDRLLKYGFKDKMNVLDAGCGVGQWSLALCSLNQFVYGTDMSSTRLQIAEKLKSSMGVSNLYLQNSNIIDTKFQDSFFDSVFLYGVLMLINEPIHVTLFEINRILKPNGILYLNVNSIGWYLHLMIDRGIKGKNIRLLITSFLMFLRGCLGLTRRAMVTQNKLIKLLTDAGFTIISIGHEGTTSLDNIDYEIATKYPNTFYGKTSIIEVIATKIV